jgi:hypothetical protein
VSRALTLRRDNDGYRVRSASLLRSVANDLKRNDALAERDLKLEPGRMAELSGGRGEIPLDLVVRAAETWPVNERDLLPMRDDCPEGLILMRASESAASSRVLQRGGSDYYEYRDTAMSRVAMFRPEWIRMLQVVDDNDPGNPAVRWNNGHLLYQFTYFVGPVNYYYRWRGTDRCIAMQTGDSIWGLPFVPHSFTSRSTRETALILALTYGAEFTGDAGAELGVLGVDAARRYSIDADDPLRAQALLLQAHLEAACLSPVEAARRSGLPLARVSELLEGAKPAATQELATLAEALAVSVRDLLVTETDTEDGVVYRPGASASEWTFPGEGRADYRIRGLARCRLHPFTHGLEIQPLCGPLGDPVALQTHQHQYAYNLGPGRLVLSWTYGGAAHHKRVGPGDSFYMKPLVPHTIRAESQRGSAPSRLLVLRIAGKVGLDVRFALGAIDASAVARVVCEDRLWYTP